MNEIVKILNKNKKKWEHYMYGYFNKLKGKYDKDDVSQMVLLKVFKKYQEDKIDMDDIENYLFLAYRNTVYTLCKKFTNKEIQYDVIIDNDTYEEEYEFYPIDSPVLNKIKKILGEDGYKEILRFYDLKGNMKRVHPNSKPEEYNYTDKDIDRFYRWREKIKKNFSKN